MSDDRFQVCVYSSVDMTGEEPPFIAVNWPVQDVTVTDIPSRADAPELFLTEWNERKSASLTEADCRFFGPALATANVRLRTDGPWAGKWEATATADKVYAVTADTEEQVKADWLEYYRTEYTKVEPNAFPNGLTDDNVDWTYNPDG